MFSCPSIGLIYSSVLVCKVLNNQGFTVLLLLGSLLERKGKNRFGGMVGHDVILHLKVGEHWYEL